jgi:hypothetical protein
MQCRRMAPKLVQIDAASSARWHPTRNLADARASPNGLLQKHAEDWRSIGDVVVNVPTWSAQRDDRYFERPNEWITGTVV